MPPNPTDERELFLQSLRDGVRAAWHSTPDGSGGEIQLVPHRKHHPELRCCVCGEVPDVGLCVDNSGGEYSPVVICTACLSLVFRAIPGLLTSSVIP